MKIKIKLIAFIALIYLTHGDASEYPMGLNQEQWITLDKKQQIELTIEQKRIDHEKEMLTQKQELLEEGKSDQSPQNNYEEYGNAVIINFNKGSMKHGKYQKDILPQSFVIKKGETQEVELLVQKQGNSFTQQETIFIHFSASATQIEIFAETPSQRKKRITVLNRGTWNKGESYENLNVESSKYIALYNLDISVRFQDKERRYEERKRNKKSQD